MQYLVGPPGDAFRISQKKDIVNYLTNYFYDWLDLWSIFYNHPQVIMDVFKIFDNCFIRYERKEMQDHQSKMQLEADRKQRRKT
jgi:hypothetical protein